jgi:hypothetical protein
MILVLIICYLYSHVVDEINLLLKKLMNLKGHFVEKESVMIEAFELEEEIKKRISSVMMSVMKQKYIIRNKDKIKEEKILLRIKKINSEINIKTSFIRSEILLLSNEKLLKYQEKASINIFFCMLHI